MKNFGFDAFVKGLGFDCVKNINFDVFVKDLKV